MKYKLEDICIKITDGSHYSPIDDPTSSIPMLSVKDMEEFDFNYNNCKHISEEEYNKMLKNDCVPKLYDVLVAKDGSYLKEIFVNEKENKKAILSSIAIFRPNQDVVDPYFLCYLLKTPMILNYVKDNCVSGSALPRIILRAFKGIELTIPGIKTQKKIVKIIKNINDKIKINNEINNNLQELAKSVYYEKFKDKSNNGILKDILDLYRKNIKIKDESLKYFPVDVLPMNYLITKDGKPNDEAKSSLVEFRKYDILIGAMRVYFHRVCLAAEDGITRTTTFVLRPKDDDYLYYSLITLDKDEFIKYANDGSKGSTMPYAVWDNNCSEYEIYVPSANEAKEFNDLVKPLFEIQIINEKNNRELEQLRDTLLPKLMNGEIELDNIEI